MKIRHIGVENELEVTGNINDIERDISKQGLLQSIGYDGGGREFRTNPISVRSLKQVRGYKYLTEYYSGLKNGTRAIESGGTHIHISILETDNPHLEVNVTALATSFYGQLQKIAGRESYWAGRLSCRSIQDVEKLIVEKREYGKKYGMDGRQCYMKGSILGPTRHQTFEFRGPKGTTASLEILAWIEFLDNIVKACNRDSIEGLSFKRLLRGKRISAYVKELSGWRLLTKDELNMRFNGSKLQ